ncbi:cNMP binding, Na H Exchanger, and/or Ion trans domain containing protein, partial [Asbolus verrucosus]
KFKIPVHYTLFAIIVGFLNGLMIYYRAVAHKYLSILKMNYLQLLYFYLPGVMFKTAFCLDTFIFQKSFLQILVVSVPVAILTGCTIGILIKLLILPHWTITLSIVFGMYCTPINSSYTERYLKRLAVHIKHTSSLLAGEATIAVINCYFVGYMVGLTTEWYNFILVVLRLIIIGVTVGYLSGLLGGFLIKKMSSDHLGVVVISFGFPFFVFGISEIYLGGSGAISVLILGVVMAKERSTLSAEADRLLGEFWTAIDKLLNMIICLTAGLYVGISCFFLQWKTSVYTLVIYFILGYGMNIKTMLICVCGGLKSPFSFMFPAMFADIMANHITPKDQLRFLFSSVTIYFLSFLVNGTFMPVLLNAMGVSQISMAKQINMNNCMKHIFAKREKVLWILKMDRYLSDANWSVVNQATIMKHPDRVGTQADDEFEDDDYFLGYRYTYCSDCKKDVAEEPTKKELQEMRKEAKLRVLKAKKMSYSRQYENGMVSKEGIRILIQAVELAMDTNEMSWFKRFVRKRVSELSRKKEEVCRPPRKYWRRVCYHILKSKVFTIFIFLITCFVVVVLLIDLIIQLKKKDYEINEKKKIDFFIIVEILSIIVYCFEFVVKIMAFSHTYICKDGFATYFKSCWNILDFLMLLIFVIDIIFEFTEHLLLGLIDSKTIWYLHRYLDGLRICRVFKLLEMCKLLYPKLIKHLDLSVDSNMAFTYELGKAYASGEEEVVKLIPQIVDHEKIQDELKQRMESDRVMITKLLGVVQKERPWIAITVKTKQAIRTIINSMKEAVLHLKATGWTDNYEQQKLMKSINDLYKCANSIKAVQPSAPKVIFKEVSWMAGDEAVFDFLFENVTVKKFEPGDVVFGEGKVADGIYIVVTGLFLLTYTPDMNILKSLKEYGILPIVDYISGMQYVENVSEYIVSGNCIGELSTLTGRAYNCTITADAHSQVYVLSHGIIKRAMELSPDFISGLECRIWKAVSVRIAIPVLMAVPTYQSCSLDQIKYALERAFMPNLINFKIFAVTDMIQDILLIEGVARDFHTRELFTAPCYIPRTVQKLILPASSLINVPINIETKLLIIPEIGVDEFDVMLLAEETCEM